MQISAITSLTSPAIAFSSQREDTMAAMEPANQEEALQFLSGRSLHVACMSGLIRDNGICSPLNRGTFYSFRNRHAQLEGIALIGHVVLVEALTPAALEAFGKIAQESKTAHLIMCEESDIDSFWGHYNLAGREMRRASRQLHFELRWPIEVAKPMATPRLAVKDDLALVMPVHAAMAYEESGVNPLESDPQGFAERCARRIEQGRTWVWVESGTLQFKADVICETPETTYIEGVWVNPEIRRRGYGLSCMSQLARLLLWRTKSLCVSINDESPQAISFFKQAGYHMRGIYDTIFLK